MDHEPRDSTAHFSDIWANAQRSRTALIQSFILEVWRHVYNNARIDGTITGTAPESKKYLGDATPRFENKSGPRGDLRIRHDRIAGDGLPGPRVSRMERGFHVVKLLCSGSVGRWQR
jgi:hypothetical protein